MNENCTVGAIFTSSGLMLFKNRDLTLEPSKAGLSKPLIANGKHKYIKFGTGKTGVWAGVNAMGVGVVGADGNGIVNLTGDQYGGGRLTWEAYEYVIANFSTVSKAFPWLLEFYDKNQIGGTGDIVLLADPDMLLIMEYASPGNWGLQFRRKNDKFDEHLPPYILRTNFFITLGGFRPNPNSSPVHMSSEYRYGSALRQLAFAGKSITVSKIKQLLQSHLNGKNTFSTCRHSHHEYNTVGSVIMHVDKDEINAHYVLNSHACEGNYQVVKLKTNA